eukprot:gene8735-11802_t
MNLVGFIGYLLRPLSHFSHKAIATFDFWMVLSFFAYLEPVIVATRFSSHTIWVQVQVAILAVNSLIYVIQCAALVTEQNNWNEFILRKGLTKRPPGLFQIFFRIFKCITRKKEYVLEGICFFIGWSGLGSRNYGIAALRLFRFFRLFWLPEIVVYNAVAHKYLKKLFKSEYVERIFLVQAFAKEGITALVSEMFRLTHATRGGVLLVLLFLFNAYVFGIVLWIEVNPISLPEVVSNGTILTSYPSMAPTMAPTYNITTTYTYYVSQQCDSLYHCMYTMIRLTLFDGTGFDFAWSLVNNNHEYLFMVLMLYVVITSFGLINGLIGLFGHTFSDASNVTLGKYGFGKIIPKYDDDSDYSDDDGDEGKGKVGSDKDPTSGVGGSGGNETRINVTDRGYKSASTNDDYDTIIPLESTDRIDDNMRESVDLSKSESVNLSRGLSHRATSSRRPKGMEKNLENIHTKVLNVMNMNTRRESEMTNLRGKLDRLTSLLSDIKDQLKDIQSENE